jgi:hypothetical protein
LAAGLLACGIAVGATDISGRWAGAPFYFIFKQDRNKLNGTGGPSVSTGTISPSRPAPSSSIFKSTATKYTAK